MKALLAGLFLVLLLAGGSARADWRDHPSYPMFHDVIEGDLSGDASPRVDRVAEAVIREWEVKSSGDCECGGPLPQIFFVGEDDAVLVRAYEILGVQDVAADKAIWRVAYEAVGAFRWLGESGDYRTVLDIFPAPRREIVEYPLVYEGHWVFENFGPPRIFVKDAIDRMDESLKSGAGPDYFFSPEVRDTPQGINMKRQYELLERLKTLTLP